MQATLPLLIFIGGFLCAFSASKVIELSDRFLELRGETEWMIVFYAPWCGHCKKMEPEWSHVAQALYGTDIRVGRVDCTRFTAMASEFKIKGFPTIIYVKGATQYTYKGDRTKDDIVGFALRMASPVVPNVDAKQLKKTIADKVTFFVYAGARQGQLWDLYLYHASEFRANNFFYSTDAVNMNAVIGKAYESEVLVFKDESHLKFGEDAEFVQDDTAAVNESLARWINDERFSIYEQITPGTLNEMWKVHKYLVITVVRMLKTGNISEQDVRFRSLVESVARNNYDHYHKHLQFGWTGSPDLANSIAMERLSTPTLLVVNVSSLEHYLPPGDCLEMDEAAVKAYLSTILDDVATALGGDTYPVRVYRAYYNARTSLEDMWSGNPVLTSVLFGLPLGFLSLICYSIWCSDILDASDQEEDSENHEKKE